MDVKNIQRMRRKYEQPISVIAEVISSLSAVAVVGKGRGHIVQSTEGPQH